MSRRDIWIGVLVLAVTAAATLSYCRGDEGWRRDTPRPAVTSDR